MPQRIDFTSDLINLVFANESTSELAVKYINYTFEDIERIIEGSEFSPTVETTVFGIIQGLQDLVSLAGSDLIEGSDELITVKFEDGFPIQVYTPALFSTKPDSDGNVSLALKVGNNLINVSDSLSFGSLKGEQPKVITTKTEDGGERVTCLVKFKSGTNDVYVIPAIIAEGVSGKNLEESLDIGHHIKGFLRQLGSGKTYLKLKDLEIGGIYPILDIIEPEGKLYGRFELVLAEGYVNPNTRLNKDLEAFLSTGESFDNFVAFFKKRALKIISKVEKGGKTYVNCTWVLQSKVNNQTKAIAPASTNDIVVTANASVVDEFPI